MIKPYIIIYQSLCIIVLLQLRLVSVRGKRYRYKNDRNMFDWKDWDENGNIKNKFVPRTVFEWIFFLLKQEGQRGHIPSIPTLFVSCFMPVNQLRKETLNMLHHPWRSFSDFIWTSHAKNFMKILLFYGMNHFMYGENSETFES